MDSQKAISDLKKNSDPEKAKLYRKFFKTGKGEYGEGDIFFGITVPKIRQVAKKYNDLSVEEIKKLMTNKVHEIRLCGLLILIAYSKKHPKEAFDLYLSHTKYINNWDLVDVSAGHIIGKYLYNKQKSILFTLARSESIWEKRIALISTFYFIRQGQPDLLFDLTEILINDKHDLIHKAAGWMLREVGKNCSQELEEKFIKKHVGHMPRTMLRYAIEKFSLEKRLYYLSQKRRPSL